MVNLPSVRQLRHLLALYDCGHFGRAAEACRVTQSTLSASIKELEAVLEATLVDRTKRRVVLTPVGIEKERRMAISGQAAHQRRLAQTLGAAAGALGYLKKSLCLITSHSPCFVLSCAFFSAISHCWRV